MLFYTEASIDLAQRPELIEAMVKANFFYVFIGIESPSPESLTEAKKFQNLRRDPLESVRFIQSQGLWVTAGFIIGFDSDTEDIFEQQTGLHRARRHSLGHGRVFAGASHYSAF